MRAHPSYFGQKVGVGDVALFASYVCRAKKWFWCDRTQIEKRSRSARGGRGTHVRAELRRITDQPVFFIRQQVGSVGRSVRPRVSRSGVARCAQRFISPRLPHSHSVPRRKSTHTHIRTRHARAPIVMIESDKIAGLTTQQPENSTQDCLDCRLSDMLNTSSSVRYAPIPNIYFLSFPVVM